MNKDARVEVRIESKLKRKVESIFHKIGISPTYAVRIFYKQVEFYKGIPFDVKIPNDETIIAMKEMENERGKTFKNTDALFDDLGI